MPSSGTDLLTAVKLNDFDQVLVIVNDFRHNALPERPPFEEALNSAVKLGHIEIVQLFLRFQVKVSWVDGDGRRAIHHAAQGGSVDVLKQVLAAGSYLNLVDRSGQSVLHCVVCSGSVDSMRYLLSQGVPVDRARTYAHKETALHAAARTGQLEMTRLLLNKGANASLSTVAGLQPLHLAVRGRHHMVAALLCERGADVTASGADGTTVAHVAAESGSVDTLHLLLDGGAAADARDAAGRTPLHRVASAKAATDGHACVADLLARCCADVDTADGAGRTPVHCAAMAGNTAVMAVLLAGGADRDRAETSESGDTPLGLAVLHEQHAATRLLLDAGADTNAADGAGMVPLHKIQSSRGEQKLAVAELLLSHGARVNAVSRRGYTPLDRCVFHTVIGVPHHGVLQRLMQAGAQLSRMKDVTNMRSVNNSPLCWLTFRGDLRLARLLVLAGWDLNSEQWCHLPGSTPPIEAFLVWLRSVAAQPRPLMPTCRSAIREVVRLNRDDRDVIPAIDQLPLPSMLKSYLCLNDILSADP